jgi:hypothetical protein
MDDLLRDGRDEEQAVLDAACALLLAFCGTKAMPCACVSNSAADRRPPGIVLTMYADLMLSGEEALVVLEREKSPIQMHLRRGLRCDSGD